MLRFCIIIYSFVSQFSLSYCWYCHNKKQSSSSVLQKKYFYKFWKNHSNAPALKTSFKWNCRSTGFNFIKIEIHTQMFTCEFCEISRSMFLKNFLSDCFGINTRSVYCPTTTFCIFKSNVTHITYYIFYAEFVAWEQERAQYFKPLARSLFSTQSNICNGTFLLKLVNNLETFSNFAPTPPASPSKKIHCRYSTRL